MTILVLSVKIAIRRVTPRFAARSQLLTGVLLPVVAISVLVEPTSVLPVEMTPVGLASISVVAATTSAAMLVVATSVLHPVVEAGKSVSRGGCRE